MQPTLLSLVEHFLVRHQMEPTTFGRLSRKDPNFVFDLRTGRDVRRSTEQAVLEFIDHYEREYPVLNSSGGPAPPDQPPARPAAPLTPGNLSATPNAETQLEAIAGELDELAEGDGGPGPIRPDVKPDEAA